MEYRNIKLKYIKRVGEIYAPQTYYFEEEDFMIASSFHQVSIITDILRNYNRLAMRPLPQFEKRGGDDNA